MKKTFTKADLLTGDIIQERNGELGVVILEKNCILYQAGGFDMLGFFTDDLFFESPNRAKDIFNVYRDRREPLCFRNVSNIKPIFQRRNDRETRKRVAELNDKGKVQALLLEPCFRRCHDVNVDLRNQWDVDIMLSEAPSMTACGQIETDRTFIRIPHTENLFIIYNRFQEERRLKMYEEDKNQGFLRDGDPIIAIPEENIHIYSRCLIVRLKSSEEADSLQNGDYEKIEVYLHRMQPMNHEILDAK